MKNDTDTITRVNGQLQRSEQLTQELLNNINIEDLSQLQRLSLAIKLMEHETRLLKLRQSCDEDHEQEIKLGLKTIMSSMRGEGDER